MTAPATNPRTLDVAYARKHFPALPEQWTLFDNAGGSVPARAVIDRVTSYMSTMQVQLGASYPMSQAASAQVQAGHAAMAQLLGADADEIVLAASTTANLRVLANGLASTWKAGDEVIVTQLDHEANIGPWRALAAQGIEIKEWKVNPKTARLDVASLQQLLGRRTRLVAFTHCANVVGAIEDVAAMTRVAHEHGAQVCVDGVAYAPHRLVDVKVLDVDFYVFSAYKVYGPHLSVLYGKRDALLAARNQNHFFVGEHEVPRKFEPGGVPHELAASLPGILDYFEALAQHHFGPPHGSKRERLAAVFELISAHESVLAERLLAFLRSRSDIRIVGPHSSEATVRVPTIAFVVADRLSGEVVRALDRSQLATRFGDFYAARAVDALGLRESEGVVRVSMTHYNTLEEVDRLVAALKTELG